MVFTARDMLRLLECIKCPYFDQCRPDINETQEDSKGMCITKYMYADEETIGS